MDLSEAEAVMDMINAKTNTQRELAVNQITGKVSGLINELRDDMVQIISNINVNIDYPEYDDVEIMTNEVLIPKITKLKNKFLFVFTIHSVAFFFSICYTIKYSRRV